MKKLYTFKNGPVFLAHPVVTIKLSPSSRICVSMSQIIQHALPSLESSRLLRLVVLASWVCDLT